LHDRAPAVVADYVHLLQSHAMAERLEHLGLAGDGDVGVRRRASGSVAEQVDRDAAARVGDAVDDVAPEIVVQEHAVDEERGRSTAALRVGDVSDRGDCVLQVGSYHDALLLPLGWKKPVRSIECDDLQTVGRYVLYRPTVGMSSAMSKRPNRKIERGEATRGQLVAIARRLFARHGYDGTSIEAVLRAADVSRGALYHHFAGT